MRFVFGPVPSRRLGRSLGVDPVPLKACDWSCVYCQLGRTATRMRERREWVPAEEVVDEVHRTLAEHDGEVDWVTFAGSGEPTLHARIGWMLRRVKALRAPPVAVITNGSLLHLPEVRRELRIADAVLPSVDAGSPERYRRINRPHPEARFEDHVQGLVTFRDEFAGRLWPEVMLVRGLNDTEEALEEIAAVLVRVRPDRIHLNTPSRSPAEPWVRPPTGAGLARARTILGAVAETVTPGPAPEEASRGASGGPHGDVGDPGELSRTVLGIVARHPMTTVELVASTGSPDPADVEAAVRSLADDGWIQGVERYGRVYWAAIGSRFPRPVRCRRRMPGGP